tara:strand:+ start:280 stop:816 length:537 start_codon:yes stop_codon:yes gene_type:complete
MKFTPWIKKGEDGKVISAMPEGAWDKQNFCSVKCAKRSHPTVLTAQARKKISARLKEIKHKPIKRGGNGQLLPLPQLALLHALGDGWEAELSVPTKKGHRNGVYPNHYKIDIANKDMMVAIEIDGGCHGTLERQEQDVRKDALLVQLGWRVFRVSNQKAMELYSTFKSVDTLLISLGA